MAFTAKLSVLLLATVLTTVAAASFAADSKAGRRTLYKYRDNNGAMVIKDHLPPDVVPRGYQVVNEYGAVLETVPPMLTAAERAEQKKLKAQQEADERARQAQIRHDRELMRQFTTVEDIMRARDTQLAALDVQISIRSGQNNLLTTQLEEMQRHAADYERRGQAMPAELIKDIKESQRQIGDNRAFVDAQTREKEKIAERFKNDIVRFKELQAQRVLNQRDDEGRLSSGNTWIMGCTDTGQCSKIWQLAQLYARENGTRSIEIVTDTLILTGKPMTERDLALAFSKVPEKTGFQIVLEVSCQNSEAGNALCSDRGQRIGRGFENYVSSRLQ